MVKLKAVRLFTAGLATTCYLRVLATRSGYDFSSDYLSDHLTVGREEVQDVYV